MPIKIQRIPLLCIFLTALLTLVACGIQPSTSDQENAQASVITQDPALTYVCRDGSILYTYRDSLPEDFSLLCERYEEQGYTLYNSSVMGNNVASTYVNGSAMAHIYRHESTGELNLVLSEDAGATLPPAIPEKANELTACTVTQMMDADSEIGMGYVVQLTDGSYIVYDGSFARQADKILQFLQEHHLGEGKPLVRAWVLTHSHRDHYEAFRVLAEQALSEEAFTVEYFIVSPLNDENYELSAESGYLSREFYREVEAFTGAKVIFAHTGMTFHFGTLSMEILFAPESYFKNTGKIYYFNNTSLVTRLFDSRYSALFLGDVGHTGTDLMVQYYGNYLQSDMCQISHHGYEDVPVSFYQVVQAPILFYPCNQQAYEMQDRYYHVRRELQDEPYTKEILIAGLAQYTRPWGTTFTEDAPLSIPDYIPSEAIKDEFFSPSPSRKIS